MCFLTGPCTTPLPPRGKAALFSHLQTSDIFKIIQYLNEIHSKKRKSHNFHVKRILIIFHGIIKIKFSGLVRNSRKIVCMQ